MSASSATYCTSGPHRNRRRSHRSHRTPSGRRCSGGWHTRTGWTYKICLQRRPKRSYLESLRLSASQVFHVKGEAGGKAEGVFKNDSGGRVRGRLTAVRLIGSVLTVVLLVTRPAHWNTAAAGAGEEVDRTFKFSLVCKRSDKKGNVMQSVRRWRRKACKSVGADLGSSSRLRSRRSRCCRHTPTTTGSTGWFSRSSGRTLL